MLFGCHRATNRVLILAWVERQLRTGVSSDVNNVDISGPGLRIDFRNRDSLTIRRKFLVTYRIHVVAALSQRAQRLS